MTPLTITVHYLIGDTVQLDVITVPAEGTYTVNQREYGRSLVHLFDKDGRKVGAVHYRQAEKIEVTGIGEGSAPNE